MGVLVGKTVGQLVTAAFKSVEASIVTPTNPGVAVGGALPEHPATQSTFSCVEATIETFCAVAPGVGLPKQGEEDRAVMVTKLLKADSCPAEFNALSSTEVGTTFKPYAT